MLKKSVAAMLSIMMVFSLTACGGETKKDSASSEKTEGEVEIPVILTTGANDSMDIQMKEPIEAFNEEYKGKYHIEVEYLAGSADDYRSKLKMLNTSNTLPAIIGAGSEPAFYDLLVENGRLVDIMPYLEKDSEWKESLMPEAIENYTRDDGKMYMVPNTGIQMSGIYYNKELFEKAGIKEFPATWDAFWEACDKLKAAGIPALSLHTTETAWCPMLLATSYLGSTEEGQNFMKEQFPSEFDTEEFKKAMDILVKEFEYTTSDAVGGTYAMAANHFFSGNTAMLPNGPWMMSSLTDEEYAQEGFAEKVGYAPYPGDIMVGSMEQNSWCITTDCEKEVIDGAVEFMKFYSGEKYAQKRAVEAGEMSSAVTFPEEEYEKAIPAMRDYVDIVGEVETVLPSYQTKWDPTIQGEVFGREIPNLVNGNITVDEFVQMLNEGAAQYKEDIQ